MRTSRLPERAAFTLVEMLVVIAIIGILAGILLTALGPVQRKALNTAIRVDIKNLSSAVEAYKLKYDDYPPDFSDKNVVRRHILKAWPNIDSTELQGMWTLFWRFPNNNANHQSRVDPAEALVFWLGGFSSDPRRPFTGKGGPIEVLPGPVYAINPDRNNGLAGFDEGRLTQDVAGGVLLSTDEVLLHGRPFAESDQFPVYLVKRRKHPFVYFDSRTYFGTPTAPTPILPPVFPPVAYAGTTTIRGAARPYRSDRPRRVVAPDPVPFQWVNKSTYQIISAGLDGHFGQAVSPASFLRRFPSGVNYLSPGDGDDDNITNFSEQSVLKDSKP